MLNVAQLSLSLLYLGFYIAKEEALLFLALPKVTLLIDSILGNLILEHLTWRNTVRTKQAEFACECFCFLVPFEVKEEMWEPFLNYPCTRVTEETQKQIKTDSWNILWYKESISLWHKRMKSHIEMSPSITLATWKLWGKWSPWSQDSNGVLWRCATRREKSQPLLNGLIWDLADVCEEMRGKKESASSPLSELFKHRSKFPEELASPCMATPQGSFGPCPLGTLHHKLGDQPQPLSCCSTLGVE